MAAYERQYGRRPVTWDGASHNEAGPLARITSRRLGDANETLKQGYGLVLPLFSLNVLLSPSKDKMKTISLSGKIVSKSSQL